MKSIVHVLPSFKKSNRTVEKDGIGKKVSFSEDPLYGFMKLFWVICCMCLCGFVYMNVYMSFPMCVLHI